MKTLKSLLMGGCAALCLSVVGPAIAADPPSNMNATLIYYDAVSNQTLDPREPQNNSSFAQGPIMAIFDSLVYLDPKGQPSPGLAESWTYNADLTEMTFKLRPNVLFHDGTKFNAAAVIHNFAYITQLGTRAGAASAEAMNQIASFEARGDDVVYLKLKQPNGQMPFLLGGQAGMMVSPAALTGDAFGATLKPIGTGPFKVRSFESTVRTVMDRFDGYWGGAAGRPATIEHTFIADGRARLNALRSGQANLALIDPRQIAEAKGAGFAVQANEKDSTWDIYVNTKRETTGNQKVRQAFMHAIDRAAVSDALGFGVSKPTVQLFSSNSPAYLPELEKRYPFDQAKAKALLKEAGYPNGVDITWLLLNTTEYKQLGEALQAMLGEVGIRIKFDVVDIAQFVQFRRPPTRGDIMMARWGGRSDPLQSFWEVTGTGGSVAAGGAAVPEIDALIEKARRMDPADPKRLAVVHDLARLTTEQASHFGIMTRSNVYAYKTGCISGLPPYLPTGNDRINDVRIAANCK